MNTEEKEVEKMNHEEIAKIEQEATRLEALAGWQESEFENYVRLAGSPREGLNWMGDPIIQASRAASFLRHAKKNMAAAAVLRAKIKDAEENTK